jgi:POT family proton-dependent oligopeptide transporter
MVLFGTEMWERFSYYGMRALLVLYMTLAVSKGGLGFDKEWAGTVYAVFTLGVYVLSIPAGLIADRWLGHWNAVLTGGLIIALGQFSLAAGGLPLFYTGLALIMMGTGLLKPNCTLLVGRLYRRDDVRRDAAFSIYYMGINIGALLAPLACGFLAQNPSFVAFLDRNGLANANGWHWAFALAGCAMLLGVAQFVLQRHRLEFVDESESETKGIAGSDPVATQDDGLRGRLMALGILLMFAILFFATFEQAGTTLTFFADERTDCRIAGWEFPSAWFQCINSAAVIVLAPLFSIMWIRLGDRQPSAPVKFALGLVFVGLSMLLLVPASYLLAGPDGAATKVAPWWLIGTYMFATIGELCLSPVGLSITSRLAPQRWSGLMMGIWLGCVGLGNFLAGMAARYSDKLPPETLFLILAIIPCAAGLALFLLAPKIRRLAGSA